MRFTSVPCLGGIIVTCLALLCSAAISAEPGPFAGFNGLWTGAGKIKLATGAEERIRCRAVYAEGDGGRALQQSLRCASDSYNFELHSDVESHGNQINGNWNETTRNVGGTLSGRAKPGTLEVRVNNPSFSADLTLVSHGDVQTVTIRSEGTQLAGASMSLRRSSRSATDRERLAPSAVAGER
jgi:hypothetical protein